MRRVKNKKNQVVILLKLLSGATGTTHRRGTPRAGALGSLLRITLLSGSRAASSRFTERIRSATIASPHRRIGFLQMHVNGFVTDRIDRTTELTTDPGSLILAIVLPHEGHFFSAPRTGNLAGPGDFATRGGATCGSFASHWHHMTPCLRSSS